MIINHNCLGICINLELIEAWIDCTNMSFHLSESKVVMDTSSSVFFWQRSGKDHFQVTNFNFRLK